MKFEKSGLTFKSHKKTKTPKTIQDIEDALKEMDKIHNTSFYSWIKDENNASVIAFKTKEMFHEYYKKDPELVYNALRFLCKDWKLSKIAELILKLFYKSTIASETLAIVIYEVSLLLENPEKVDLISLLLIGEEPRNVSFFLYHFFKYTEIKYREHTEILDEEEFLDEMNAFCSGILECLFTCLKWNNDYFRIFILEYVKLSTEEVDIRRDFLTRMVNVKYSNFQQQLTNKHGTIKSNENKTKIVNDIEVDNDLIKNNKIEVPEEIFMESLNFGILVFNMYQVVMRTDVDELLTVDPPRKDVSNSETSLDDKCRSEESVDENIDDEGCCLTVSNTENDLCNIISIEGDGEDRIKKEESSATLYMEDDENFDHDDYSFDDQELSITKDMSSIYCLGDSNEASYSNNDMNENIIIEDTKESTYSYVDNDNHEASDNDNEDKDQDLLDDFINKSFPSTYSNSRRNSTISYTSFLSDHDNNDGGIEENKLNVSKEINLDGTGGNDNENNYSENLTSLRRNSRYSLHLSIDSLPCVETDDRRINSSSCCSCRFNNYSDNLLHIFPSPPNSPAIASAPQSPSFMMNPIEFDNNNNNNFNNNNNNNNNELYLNLNDLNTNLPNDSISSPQHSTTNNSFLSPFSPEMITPSPIVQSLSTDNILVNSYGYSCTFNHINSTPNLYSNTTRDSN